MTSRAGASRRRSVFRAVVLVLSSVSTLCLGEAVVRIICPFNMWLVRSPRGYLLNVPDASIQHREAGRIVTYRFNSLHQRGGANPDQGNSVLVLGDSVTFGYLIDEGRTYVAQIARACDRELGAGRFAFLNAATAGWGTADYLSYVEEFGEAVQPKVVLVFMNSDDIGRSERRELYRLTNPVTLELEPRTLEEDLSRTTRLLLAIPGYAHVRERSHLLQHARRAWARASRRAAATGTTGTTSKPIDPRQSVALGKALFHGLNAWCRVHGARLLVLTTGLQPWHFARPEVYGDFQSTRAFLDQAESFFASEGIPFHDLSSALVARAGKDPAPFSIPGEGHPNEAAQDLIADLAWPWLRGALSP